MLGLKVIVREYAQNTALGVHPRLQSRWELFMPQLHGMCLGQTHRY